ncbi:MAG: hypothetical protein EBR02_10500, partial [Alphaproteobacteria bacterium]|nr:hypothetical protein [Alphaproteobacteria bacterium]
MTHTENQLDILEKVKNTPLLCVGDVMLDRYVYGTVDRLSPEAPVPVLLENRVVVTAGGAGNVAMNLKGLGCAVRLVAVAGADHAAETLENTLAGIDATLIIDDTRPTISKTRYCVGAQQMLRVDAEKTGNLAPDIEVALLKSALEALDGAKALLLSDYGKGTLTPNVLKTLVTAAKKAGIPVVVDPKGRD